MWNAQVGFVGRVGVGPWVLVSTPCYHYFCVGALDEFSVRFQQGAEEERDLGGQLVNDVVQVNCKPRGPSGAPSCQ